MIKNRNLAAALGLGLAMAFSSANAAEPGWYMGVAAGQSTADIDQDELDFIVEDAFFFAGAPIISGDSSLEDSDTTFSIFGGYRLNQYLAIEAAYVDLGTAEYRAEGLVNPPGPIASWPASASVDFSTTGFSTTLLGAIPLGEAFDIHGKVGVLFSDTEVKFGVEINGAESSEKFSGTDTDVFYGAGVSWYIGTNWMVGLDYLLYKDVGNEDDTDETDIDTVTLQVGYRF